MRRIDIKIYPESQEAPALLHFTGSGKFNRSLSRLANVMGYSLSEHGLRPVTKQGDKLIPRGPYEDLRSERDIFDFLGVRWTEPSARKGKFSIKSPLDGTPWFGGGLPEKPQLQAAAESLRRLALPMAAGPSGELPALPMPAASGELPALGDARMYDDDDGDDDAGLPPLARD